MERCSTSLFTGAMHIKTTVRYHLTSDRMAILQSTIDSRWRCGEKGILVHCWWECPWYNCYGKWYRAPQTKYYGTKYYLMIHCWTFFQGKQKHEKYTCTSAFMLLLLTRRKIQRPPESPLIDEWIRKKEKLIFIEALPVSTTFTLKPSYASHSKPLHKTKHTSLVTKQSQGPLVTPQES